MQTTTAKITRTPYDYYELLKLVEAKGKELYGARYEIEEIDRPVVLKLLTYFLQDETIASEQRIDLYKGLIVTGFIGCGKTAIMRIMKVLLPRQRQFMIRSCARIAHDFAEEGYKVISRHTTGSYEPYTTVPRAACSLIALWISSCRQ